MNRLIKVSGKVQVDDDALDKFLVTYDDFIYALENDIKPVKVLKYIIFFFNLRHLV